MRLYQRETGESKESADVEYLEERAVPNRAANEHRHEQPKRSVDRGPFASGEIRWIFKIASEPDG